MCTYVSDNHWRYIELLFKIQYAYRTSMQFKTLSPPQEGGTLQSVMYKQKKTKTMLKVPFTIVHGTEVHKFTVDCQLVDGELEWVCPILPSTALGYDLEVMVTNSEVSQHQRTLTCSSKQHWIQLITMHSLYECMQDYSFGKGIVNSHYPPFVDMILQLIN